MTMRALISLCYSPDPIDQFQSLPILTMRNGVIENSLSKDRSSVGVISAMASFLTSGADYVVSGAATQGYS